VDRGFFLQQLVLVIAMNTGGDASQKSGISMA
jgi:hypothetical protein